MSYTDYDEPFVDPDILKKANQAHDAELARKGINLKTRGRIGSAWNAEKLIVKGKLTDKKVEQYEKRGFYSEAFRSARREVWDAKKAKREKREGNFKLVGGRMIYAP